MTARVEITPKGVKFINSKGLVVREYATPTPHPREEWSFFRECYCEDYDLVREERDSLLLEVDELRHRIAQLEDR